MASTQRINATTTAVTEKCIYTWMIKNYRVIKTKNKELIRSPEFSVGSDDKKYFVLHWFPEGDREETVGFISLYLAYLRTDAKKKPDKLICRSTISVINDGKVVTQFTLHQNFILQSPQSWGRMKFFEVKNIDKLISSKNTVTIQCELEIFKEYESLLNSKIIDNEEETIHGMTFNLSFLSEEFSDVELITSDDNSIPAHKIILATASPVFKAMFTHDMLERKSNSVEIIDTPYNILIEMLRYIYTGEIIRTKTHIVLEILAVADKYQIDNLKIKCGKILCDALSTENAIELLTAAHKYNVENLKSEVLEFVTAHIQTFFDTAKLKKIAGPDVLFNVVESITNSLK